MILVVPIFQFCNFLFKSQTKYTNLLFVKFATKKYESIRLCWGRLIREGSKNLDGLINSSLEKGIWITNRYL